MKSEKLDNEVLGVVLGFAATALGFLIYGLIWAHLLQGDKTLSYFVNELFLANKDAQPKILSISVIGILPFFQYFNHIDKTRLMRGLLISIFILAIIIVTLLI